MSVHALQARRSPTSPAYWAASSSGEQLAQLRALGDPQLGGQLVAAQQRRRRPVAAPVEGGGDHLAGKAPGAPRPSPRLAKRAGAAGGEPVGDGEQGDVDGDRLGRAQVLVDPARRQRRLGDQEAEPQVVEGQRPAGAG